MKSLKNNHKKHNLIRFMPYYRGKKIITIFIIDSIFAVLIGSLAVGLPFLTQFIIREVQKLAGKTSSDYSMLYLGIGLLVLVSITSLISNWIVVYWGHMMGINMEIKMREKTIRKMHKLRMEYYDRTPIGSFISRMVTDLRDIPEFAHHAPEDFIIGTVTLVGGITFSFLQTWIIGVVFVAIFIFGVIALYFVRIKWRKVSEDMKENNSEMSSSIGRQAEGISEIKSFVTENYEYSLFEKLHIKYRKINFRFYRIEGMASVTTIFIGLTTTLIALAVGGVLVANGTIDVGSLTGLTAAAAIMNQPINKFVAVFTMLSRGASSINRYFEFMELPEEPNNGKIVDFVAKGKIEFRNVSFSYVDKNSKNIQVLKNFNLLINPGEKIAFVGETGIGKSTILKLILRFYEADEGEIFMDNINIKDIEVHALRRQISYIQQNPTIFDDTIANNISYGSSNATPEAVQNAIKISFINEFIEKTADGYNTVVGPRGAMLSGGQKQRLSIARAVLKNNPILLLDEATSALDNETESKIKHSIEEISENKTLLIVAHRLSTIKNVDRVIVLGGGGKILESGTFEELSRKKDGHLQRLENIK